MSKILQLAVQCSLKTNRTTTKDVSSCSGSRNMILFDSERASRTEKRDLYVREVSNLRNKQNSAVKIWYLHVLY